MSSSLGKCPSQHTSALFGVRHSTEVRGVAPSLLPARPESVRSGERRADWLRSGAQRCDWLRHEMRDAYQCVRQSADQITRPWPPDMASASIM